MKNCNDLTEKNIIAQIYGTILPESNNNGFNFKGKMFLTKLLRFLYQNKHHSFAFTYCILIITNPIIITFQDGTVNIRGFKFTFTKIFFEFYDLKTNTIKTFNISAMRYIFMSL